MKTTVRNHKELDRFLDRLSQADLNFDKHPWDIIVEKHDTGLSAAQRNLYYQWVGRYIAPHHGYTKDEMHDELKRMFIEPVCRTGLDGTTYEVRPSIKKLKVKEMSDYMDKVDTWAGSNGIFLPRPEDAHAR